MSARLPPAYRRAMHEYGLVEDLLAQVDAQVRGHAGRRAVRVVLAIDGGHIDEGFLRDAFDTFKVETTARDAELFVTRAPIDVWCPDCGTRRMVTDRDAACPDCGGACVQMTTTDEIRLESVEIEV